jgi:GntR family transcriptional regulator / MocR family aminotransferase
MRLRYRHRHRALIAALERQLPTWRPAPSAGGLHQLMTLPPGTDEPALLTAAARRGVGMECLSQHSCKGASAPGLVLGHAHLSEPAIARGVQLLKEAAASLRRGGDLS